MMMSIDVVSGITAKCTSLADAVRGLVHNGDTVALEGFTHLIPVAAGQEIIRQNKQDLTLVRMTPDIVYDQLIGAGCARKLIFSWGGNPGVGSLHRFRDAVQNHWPVPLEIEEHSHAGMANRYLAGAAGLPFAVLRGYSGTDLVKVTATIKPITCPFTGEQLTAVPAITPDVTIIHAQRADRSGNVQLWGLIGVQKEAVLAAKRSIVTVEEIVDELTPVAGQVIIPYWAITAVAHVPNGAHPSYAAGYTQRDNAYYQAWDAISRDREAFGRWLGGVRGPAAEYAVPLPADGQRIKPPAPATPLIPTTSTTDRIAPATRTELMTVTASRSLKSGDTCFVGIGKPSTAANLARRTHAPDLVLIYESGCLGSKPQVLPLSIGDGVLAETADAVISVPEMFNYWLQGGRITTGFLGAAQIDKFGNINTTVIGGTYCDPKVRLPGAGGAPEIAASCGKVVVIVTQSTRTFVEKVDFVTSLGFGTGKGDRERLGLRGRGPIRIITDLGVLEPDPDTCKLVLVAVHPAVTVDQVTAATGWDLKVSDRLTQLQPPTNEELAALRALEATLEG